MVSGRILCRVAEAELNIESILRDVTKIDLPSHLESLLRSGYPHRVDEVKLPAFSAAERSEDEDRRSMFRAQILALRNPKNEGSASITP